MKVNHSAFFMHINVLLEKISTFLFTACTSVRILPLLKIFPLLTGTRTGLKLSITLVSFAACKGMNDRNAEMVQFKRCMTSQSYSIPKLNKRNT